MRRTRWLRPARWLPRSLVGRVFALYTLALLAFVVVALGLFYRYDFLDQLERAQARADALLAVMAPLVADNAVIGDYDTIRRTLEHALDNTELAAAAFIDLRGTAVRAERSARLQSPRWLRERVAQRLYDSNHPIVVGGRDYGVLRLNFDADTLAAGLWHNGCSALALAATGLALGLLLFRVALVRWLRAFERLPAFEQELLDGAPVPDLGRDAPLEFQRTFSVLKQAAAGLQAELRAREAALAALRGLLEATMPGTRPRAGDGNDLEAVSQLVADLVQRLHEHGEQLDAIFALSPDGFVSFDGQRIVQYASPAFSRLTGIDTSDVLGLEEPEFVRLLAACCAQPEALPAFEQLRSLDQGPPEATRRRLIDIARPTRRALEIALRRGDGRAVSQVLHLRDVTHETEVDQMKSEFLSTAAHELRTPMTSIYGFMELMLMRPQPPERQRDIVETVHRQTQLMIEILNELLDLSRIEARRGKDFELQVLALPAFVAEVVHDFNPPGGREPPRLGTAAGALAVRVDRSKLRQALNNVLSNAYKYSPGGGEVAIDFLPDAAGAPRIGLAVRDPGIGMTPAQLARVCERFYRADASGTIPGTGLGMSLVKEIVELLGGSLQIDSTPGVGSRVVLWLPLAHEKVPALS